MDIGKLRHQVCLQRPVDTQDEYGKSVTTWEQMARAHAAVQSASGTENVDNGQITAQVTHIVSLRYLPGLTPHWRVLWDGKILQIVEIKTDATARRWQTLKCSEVLNGTPEGLCTWR